MTEQKSSIGVHSAGDDINWKYLNEERIEDPIINALVKEANSIYIKKENTNSKIDSNNIDIYINNFNKFLQDNKYKHILSLPVVVKSNENTKAKKLSKKELIIQNAKEDNIKKDMKGFIDSLVINNNMPLHNKKNIESFFSILFWNIYLLKNKKNNIDVSFYLNSAISLYRAINESNDFLIDSLKTESFEILDKIEEIIYSKGNNSKYIFKIISDNLLFILESYWDKIKPKSTVLYNEQKEIISYVIDNLNNKKLIFFEMPPANGKTILSAILAKIIAHKNKENILNVPKYKRKTLLYICYNTIVRNEVAKLCITHNVDVKYWLAVNKPDKMDGKLKTFLRPYKNCYPDWNKKNLRNKKEQDTYDSQKYMRFSEDINVQWKFFINETRPISEQIKNIKDYSNPENLPEMIISDLDSAYILLSNFPDTFVTYFDEAFASASLEITSKIMSVLGLTVLVSATLAKPEEIPTVLNNFKERHKYTDNSFLHVVKSTKQHISCTFIDESGYIFTPHDKCNTIDELKDFILTLDKPLIRRSYSPEVVFNISNIIDIDLPNELKFINNFKYFGMINHESLRDYMCLILQYISNTDNIVLFDKIKNIKVKKISDMDITKLFTSSSVYYDNGKTLHVATSNNFNLHVENIATPFLNGSPKVVDISLMYERECKVIKDQIKNLEKNGDKDSDYERNKLFRDLDNIRLKWPYEYILNSRQHANKYDNLSILTNPNNEIFAQYNDLELLDLTRTKLLFSGIGIYQPEAFNMQEMDFFLRKKDAFKFILSTPSIVYGTNISLSIIDIDKSFIVDSTKNTLYQLIGRAGRKGKSHSATIIFRDNKMIDMILENNNKNIEAEQIETNYQNILLLK
jgi:hypothetical protein